MINIVSVQNSITGSQSFKDQDKSLYLNPRGSSSLPAALSALRPPARTWLESEE